MTASSTTSLSFSQTPGAIADSGESETSSTRQRDDRPTPADDVRVVPGVLLNRPPEPRCGFRVSSFGG